MSESIEPAASRLPEQIVAIQPTSNVEIDVHSSEPEKKPQLTKWKVVEELGVPIFDVLGPEAKRVGTLNCGLVVTSTESKGRWIHHETGWSLIRDEDGQLLRKVPVESQEGTQQRATQGEEDVEGAARAARFAQNQARNQSKIVTEMSSSTNANQSVSGYIHARQQERQAMEQARQAQAVNAAFNLSVGRNFPSYRAQADAHGQPVVRRSYCLVVLGAIYLVIVLAARSSDGASQTGWIVSLIESIYIIAMGTCGIWAVWNYVSACAGCHFAAIVFYILLMVIANSILINAVATCDPKVTQGCPDDPASSIPYLVIVGFIIPVVLCSICACQAWRFWRAVDLAEKAEDQLMNNPHGGNGSAASSGRVSSGGATAVANTV